MHTLDLEQAAPYSGCPEELFLHARPFASQGESRLVALFGHATGLCRGNYDGHKAEASRVQQLGERPVYTLTTQATGGCTKRLTSAGMTTASRIWRGCSCSCDCQKSESRAR